MHYQSKYCEENIWHLCQDDQVGAGRRLAVFVSSAKNQCPIWCQKVASDPKEPVVWDYHVIMLHQIAEGWQVWDFDTRLLLPVSLDVYLDNSFYPAGELPEDYEPLFRVMEADEYVETFSSNRSHMRGESGKWLATPPAWPVMLRPEVGMNLPRFWDMKDAICGEVMGLAALQARFGDKN